MANFAIVSTGDSLDALNYVVSNLNNSGNANISGNVLTANTTTGEITDNATGSVISYLYQDIDVRYADDSAGTINFSVSPTNRLYYGLRNRAPTTPVSSNGADYIWYLVSGGGFSTTKFLFYNTIGGRQIQFSVTTTAPTSLWQQTINNTPIDLDVVSASQAQQLAVFSVFLRSASAPATPTGGSYNFSTLTLTPPAGWAVSIPAGTNPVYSSQATFEAPVSGSTAGPSGAYSTPVVIAQDGTSGTSTFIVIAYARYTSTPATPTTNTGSWNFTTNTGTPPTASDGVPLVLAPTTRSGGPDQFQAPTQNTRNSGTDPTLVWTAPVGVGSTPGADGVSVYYYSVFQNAVSTPAVPTGGFFNFGTGVATPPAGWANFPTNVSNNFTFVTSAQVLTGVPTANVAIGNTWGNVVQFTGQTGNAGTNGQNGWTANVFPAVINYVMNGNGTYTTANTTVVTSFMDGTTTDSATIYSTINGVGTITINNGVISPNITVTTISNVSSKSTTVGFRHTPSNSSATSLTTVSSFPFTSADAYGGQTIFGPDGAAVGTIAAAPVISTGYSAGQYFTRNTANVWTPTPVANVVSTTANVVAARGNSVQGYVNQTINYNINTGAWTTSTGSTLNPGRFGFGTPATSSTNYFNSVTYTDPDGTTSSQVQAAIIQSGLNGNAGVQGNRGFLPMAYVITPATPIGATQGNLTTWFSALRTAVSAPIGTGYSPVDGDTASFTWALGSGTPNAVYSYNSANTWVSATGQVINGNVIVTGTITAGQMNVNDIYALTMSGGTVTPGTYSGTGYWLQANTGNAYLGGTLVVGNSVTIGTAISGGALAANSVTAGTIAANAVTVGTIAAGAVNAGTIAANAVTAGTIAANVVTAGTIAANAVTAGTIAAGAVTTNSMTANSINASVILANTITSTQIAANTITANQIAGNTITAGQIAANTITAGQIAGNTITANQIAANTITATQISTAFLYAGNIVSTNGDIGNTSSPGYWLRYSDGDARFGGNVNIGGNVTVGNIILSGSLANNIVVYDNLSPGLVPNPAGTISITTTPRAFSGSTGWSQTTVNWYDLVLASVTLPYSSAYSVTGAPNPRFNFTFASNIAFTMGTAGISFPYVQYYYKTLVPAGGNALPGASYTSIGSAVSLTGTTSFSGVVAPQVSSFQIPVGSWSPTTSVIVGVALFASIVPTYAVTGNVLSTTFTVSNG